MFGSTPNRDTFLGLADWDGSMILVTQLAKHILGTYEFAEQRKYVARLIHFSPYKKLAVSNTCFENTGRNLLIWHSNDSHTAYQADNKLLRSGWERSSENCKSYRGEQKGNKNGTSNICFRANLGVHLMANDLFRRRFTMAILESSAK